MDSLSPLATQFSIYDIHTAIKKTLTQFSLNLILAHIRCGYMTDQKKDAGQRTQHDPMGSCDNCVPHPTPPPLYLLTPDR